MLQEDNALIAEEEEQEYIDTEDESAGRWMRIFTRLIFLGIIGQICLAGYLISEGMNVPPPPTSEKRPEDRVATPVVN
jgi:hypothetical protein